MSFEITRFNLSNITLVYSKINLTMMLEQLGHEFKPMLAGKISNVNLIFSRTCCCPVMPTSCRVFDNLLRNAVSYCYENTTIQVNARQAEDHVLIKIINEGDTIPRERLERIFEQFIALICREAQAPAEPVWDLRLQGRLWNCTMDRSLPAAKTVSPV